jgi:menaquinone-dependent protoporphyrinogen oxidase
MQTMPIEGNMKETPIKRKTMNRRQFLRLAGIGLGASTLVCAGAGAWAAGLGGQDQPEGDPTLFSFPDITLGDHAMSKKILVTYASQSGSTGGVAEAIGKTLAGGGVQVDVRPVGSVGSLDGYAAVVLGSAIHSGKWLPEMVNFVQANQGRLRQLPTAFFLVCMMAAVDTEMNRNAVAQWLAEEQALVRPVAIGRFAGALFPNKYFFTTAIGLRIFLAYLKLPGGDYRNWDAIRAWSASALPLLVG